MRISKLPASAIDRLMAVDSHADRLARMAAIAESEVAGARSLMNGHSKADAASVLRARTEFPETLKRAQASRVAADAAVRAASSCKAFVDGLPDSAELEVVEVKPNGVDLAECRNRIASIRTEINRIKSLPAPSDRELIETFVDEIRRPAEQQIAEMLTRWPHFTSAEHIAMGIDRTAMAALQVVIAPAEAIVSYLCERIDATADKAMPPADRPVRIVELEQQLLQLQSLEAHFVNGAVANGESE